MIMAGYEYRGEKPFGNVYFTGIVRDKIGRKMSKQLGNSPDPLDLIAKYGADGMRMAMLISSSAGNDVMFDEALCEQGRNFGNKIWNAYRLVNGWSADDKTAQDDNNRLAVEWFRQTLGRALRQIDEDFRSYRISEAFMTAYKLFWDDFSGLYLEMVKPAYGQPVDAETFAATCGFFDELMRVLHPFMPFVTEEIWQDLAPRKEGESICTAPMPQPVEADERLLARFELAKEAIDYTVPDDYRTHYERIRNKDTELVACPYFTTHLCDATFSVLCDYSALDSFVVLIFVAGAGELVDSEGNRVAVQQGETVLIPASTRQVTLLPGHGGLRFLSSYIETPEE